MNILETTSYVHFPVHLLVPILPIYHHTRNTDICLFLLKTIKISINICNWVFHGNHLFVFVYSHTTVNVWSLGIYIGTGRKQHDITNISRCLFPSLYIELNPNKTTEYSYFISILLTPILYICISI